MCTILGCWYWRYIQVGVGQEIERWRVRTSTPARALLRSNLRQVVYILVPLSSGRICWYRCINREGNNTIGLLQPRRLELATHLTLRPRQLESTDFPKFLKNAITPVLSVTNKAHTGWAKTRTVSLTVCNSRICWHRIVFYISNGSVFIQCKTGVLYVTI